MRNTGTFYQVSSTWLKKNWFLGKCVKKKTPLILQWFIPIHRAIVIKQIHSIYVALKFHGGGRVIKKNKYLKGSWEKGQ